MRNEIRELVISDIHLESNGCNAKTLLATLREHFKNPALEKVIIAGDLIGKNGGEMLDDERFGLLTFLRQNRERIIYVDGNHDPANTIINEFVGVRAVEKYEWEANGKKFCVLHGHRFDWFWPVLGERMFNFLFWVFLLLQKIDKKKKHVAGLANWLHLKLSRKVARKAARYAKKRHIDVIICGHTHEALCKLFKTRSGRVIAYFNCGSWIGDNCSFVTIDYKGKAKLNFV